ncbi:MAG: hypothetical protein II776_03670 [Clostridia bacterium]|nr:hypothetical protein [Clostridia bacterium]
MKKQAEEGLDGYDWYEGQPKWPLRRVVGTAVAAISVFIYVFLFFRFCTAFSGGVGEVIFLTGESARVYPSENAVVRRFYPATGEEDDGTVQVQYVVALEDTEDFQLTLKIRKKAHPPAGEEPGYRVVLRRDLDGETRFFEAADCRVKDSFGYRYLVPTFHGVSDAEHATLTILLLPGGDDGEPTLSRASFSAVVGGSSVYSARVYPKDDAFVPVKE